MGITLDNTGDSGSVDITLNKVTHYAISCINKFPVQEVVGKDTGSVDTDAYTTNPTKYNISATITDAEKTTLTTLRNEKSKTCKLSDGLLSNKNTRPESVNFVARPGHTDYPWTATIIMVGEDH